MIDGYTIFERHPGTEIEEVLDKFDNYGDNIVHEIATNDIIAHNIEDDSDDTTFIKDDVEEAEKNEQAEKNEIIDIEEDNTKYEHEISRTFGRRRRA